ncbi:23319_t:CDS:2, partial [Gigaspora rosea]
ETGIDTGDADEVITLQFTNKSYFAEELIPLPDNPYDLEEEWKKNFPITEPK